MQERASRRVDAQRAIHHRRMQPTADDASRIRPTRWPLVSGQPLIAVCVAMSTCRHGAPTPPALYRILRL